MSTQSNTPASNASPTSHPLPREGGRGDSATFVATATDDGNCVAIVGGGPAGLALAIALHRHGVAASVFDARPKGAAQQDKRTLALAHGSRQSLEWLGVWPQIRSAPIRTIHISQKGGLGMTRLAAGDYGLPALGYVAQAATLAGALEAEADRLRIPIQHEALVDADSVRVLDDAIAFTAGATEHRAALLAFAEGAVAADAPLQQRDYGQSAVICNATLSAPHRGNAWERFTTHGPVALLPLDGDRQVAVVYTCPPEQAASCQAEDDTQFIARLRAEFGGRLDFEAVTARHVFPLGLRYRRTTVGPRQVWLGNAAQTLHPVAGQGYNLALRDVRDLARTLAGASDPGSVDLLQTYEARRRMDRRGTIGFTDSLVRLFSNDNAVLRHARGAGLLALDLLPGARNFVARRMIWGGRAW